MAFLPSTMRRAFIHPWEEEGLDAELLPKRFGVAVPEDITDVKSLLLWASERYGVTQFLGPRGCWMLVDQDLTGILPGEFDVHFRKPPPAVTNSDEWGNELALRTAPSSIDNKIAMQLQGLDSSTLKPIGSKPAFYNYRPVSATPPLPLTLAHPVFAKFWDIFHGIGTQPGREDYSHFSKLSLLCSNFYTEEADYRDQVAEFWQSYTGIQFVNELNTGGLGARNLKLKALFASLEAKLGTFGSESDPGFRSPQYVRLYWTRKGDRERFSNTCYPALAIEHIGPSIRVSAVAVLDSFCCMPLTPFVNLLAMQSHDVEAAKQGARLCLAVKVALRELDGFYADFKQGARRDLFFKTCMPYPMHGYQLPPVRFQEKLVYLVREPGEARAVVKFVQQPYGVDVHRAWAAAGFAPELYEVCQLAGGWWEVRMEHLGKEWKRLDACPDADEMRPLVLAALDKVHELPVNGLGQVGVHGDMRDVNVMVSSVGGEVKFKFIDFDWARPEGCASACYPPFMNHSQIDWAEGVEDGGRMLQRHDKELLSIPSFFAGF